jgi:proline iminopeptidase
MAADTVGLMDALQLREAHVVGASMGGMIAQQVAAEYPARAKSLVSIMSTSGDRRLPPATRDAQRALFARPANPHDQNSIVEHSMKIWGVIGSPGFPTDPAELRARTQRSVARSYHPQGVARQLVGILASGDRSKDLATIRTPTLVIHGDCDPLVRPACGEDTARKIPGATLRIIKGMGHDMAAWPILADQILGHVRAH